MIIPLSKMRPFIPMLSFNLITRRTPMVRLLTFHTIFFQFPGRIKWLYISSVVPYKIYVKWCLTKFMLTTKTHFDTSIILGKCIVQETLS